MFLVLPLAMDEQDSTGDLRQWQVAGVGRFGLGVVDLAPGGRAPLGRRPCVTKRNL